MNEGEKERENRRMLDGGCEGREEMEGYATESLWEGHF